MQYYKVLPSNNVQENKILCPSYRNTLSLYLYILISVVEIRIVIVV
jgi:hypothetical protein